MSKPHRIFFVSSFTIYSNRGRTGSPDCSEDPGGCVYLEVAGTCNSRFGLIIPVPLAPNHICG
jgi:hypothetical protein